jgi:hypothetical protein
MALAAVLGDVSEERVHAAIIGSVTDRSTLACCSHEAGPAQLRQMEGQSRCRDFESLGDRTGGHTFRTFPHQQSENGEPSFLGQRGERLNRVILISYL